MIGNFKDVTETLKNSLAESPLGKQLKNIDFNNMDKDVDSPLNTYANDAQVTSGKEVLNNVEVSKTETSDGSLKPGLTDTEKSNIKEQTGWDDRIIDNIQSLDQFNVLKSADLIETTINGRPCLIKNNIDLDFKDAFGNTNKDRMDMGLSPIDKITGKPIELHHLGQKADSPFVELTAEEHRTGEYIDGKKNQSLWHDNSIESQVHGGEKENVFREQREEHWEARAQDL